MSTSVKYDDKFDPSKLTTVKLEQAFRDGSIVKEVVPKFSGEGELDGVEPMFYVKDAYEQACNSLQWNEPEEKFEHFVKVLDGLAKSFWIDTIQSQFANIDRNSWNEAWKIMAIQFGGAGKHSKDNLIHYLQSGECKKRTNSTVSGHVSRLLRLIKIANQLPGSEVEPLSKARVNEIIINSMPRKWIISLQSIHSDYINMSIPELEDFFCRQKDIADQLVLERKNQPTSRKRDHTMHASSNETIRAAHKFQQDAKVYDPAFQCRRHPNSKHMWSQCYLNPKNKDAKHFKTNRSETIVAHTSGQPQHRQEVHFEEQEDTGENQLIIMKDDDVKEAENLWGQYSDKSFVYSYSPEEAKKIDDKNDICPVTILVPQKINNIQSDRILKALLDTGASCSTISRSILPEGCITTKISPLKIVGLNGTTEVTEQVILEKSMLAEFSKAFKITEIKCYVSDNTGRYDIIIGRDIISPQHMIFNFAEKTMSWMDIDIEMKDYNYWSKTNISGLFKDIMAMEILPSKYDNVSPEDIINQQPHLTESQREDLRKLLSEFPVLFNGKLKKYPHKKFHLQLKPNAQPHQSRAYPVPMTNRQVYKDELDRLVKQDVIEPSDREEWLAASFIRPKKDGRVRVVTDFRKLNENLIRKRYELPRIQEVLRRRTGYKYFTKLDISMQYYTFELDEESMRLCTTVTPFGIYRYKRLPMGIIESPDIAQETMEKVLHGIDCEIYIDDIAIFSDTWEEHLATLRQVLHRLQDNGFTVNPLKCEWAVKETDWLGYWLTPRGLKPWSKKVQGILALKSPQNQKQLRSFIGAITFYQDMWKRHSHILAPLTDLVGKKTFQWGLEQEKAFQEAKALLVKDVLIAYPDHNKPFHIFADSSDYQLGATICQVHDNIKTPVAYFSRKLNPAQRNYPIGEKEMLSIVETLKNYRTMMLGAEIHVYTDHKNLTYLKSDNQRILRWKLLIEEFHPHFHSIPGEQNTFADMLSRNEMDDEILVEKTGPSNDDDYEENYFYQDIIQDDSRVAECLINHPSIEELAFPLKYETIRILQLEDDELRELIKNETEHISYKTTIPNVELVHYKDKIYIPTTHVAKIVAWYHLVLNHAGQTKLLETITQTMYNKHFASKIQAIVETCPYCQRCKRSTLKYGHLPPKIITMEPWYTVAVDLIGPWNIKLNGQEYQFNALTMIDINTNFTEAVQIHEKTAEHIAMKFENNWIAKFPRPMECMHDNGSEFIGTKFQELLQRAGIKDKPTTIKNPQANAICERMHQTVANQLRPILQERPPKTLQEAQNLVDTMIANTVYALRAAVHTTLETSPAALVFQRDMILNVPFIANLQTIQERRQQLIDKNNERENAKCIDFNYEVGQQVLITSNASRKLDPPFIGPYTITEIHVNGTITIQRAPNVTERINIRQVKPFRSL